MNHSTTDDREPERRKTVTYIPALDGEQRKFREFVKRLRSTSRDVLRREVDRCLDDNLTTENLRLFIAESLLLDLVEQGWEVERWNRLRLQPPDDEDCDPAATKERIRAAHLVERRAYLRQAPVRAFVAEMEKRRLVKGTWKSIFSLMRDGEHLALELAKAGEAGDREAVGRALSGVIAPYLQFVTPGATCEHTGLLLSDVWRYFRLTWVNTPKSVPGRSIMVLVRDAAAENHAVIGIACLASAVVQQKLRDRWIGWHTEPFLKKLGATPTTATGRWLLSSIEALIDAIYQVDLVEDGIVTRGEIARPTEQCIQRLQEAADQARRLHALYPSPTEHKKAREDWRRAALTPLFRWKRCATLARLLNIRRAFQLAGMTTGMRSELISAASQSRFRDAAAQLLRLIKAEQVGIGMMDITVCGAIPPYNHLLGGKLVCTLLFSPEVVEYYRERYWDQDSIIASSVQGAAVRRPPKLVLLCTTSLYGSASSQYNRLKIPLRDLDPAADKEVALEFEKLGLSKGFGSFHVGETTVRAIELLLSRRVEGRRVNSIFGEGVNPKMRKIREAISMLGLPADEILKHGNYRLVYGVPLAGNFREVLLGMAHRPAYYMPQDTGRRGTDALAEFWRRRWLAGRIGRPAVLASVASHRLTFPISHGARAPHEVEDDTEEQLALFSGDD